MSEEIKLFIKYEKGEISKAIFKAANQRLSQKAIPIGIVLLLGLAISYYGWQSVCLSVGWLLFFILIIPIVYLILCLAAFILTCSEKRYKDGIEITFRENNVLWKGKDFQSEAEWSYFKDYLEDMVVFMIHLADGRYLMIPKRVFESKEKMVQLRTLLKSKLKETFLSRSISKRVQAEG